LRFGSCERLLMMLSVRPSDRYSAFGSLLSFTNGRIATEVIGRRELLMKSTAPTTARITNTPTRPYASHRGRTKVTPVLIGTVVRSVSVCDLVTSGTVDLKSASVSRAVDLVSSGYSDV